MAVSLCLGVMLSALIGRISNFNTWTAQPRHAGGRGLRPRTLMSAVGYNTAQCFPALFSLKGWTRSNQRGGGNATRRRRFLKIQPPGNAGTLRRFCCCGVAWRADGCDGRPCGGDQVSRRKMTLTVDVRLFTSSSKLARAGTGRREAGTDLPQGDISAMEPA
jgi:hypothetical protein